MADKIYGGLLSSIGGETWIDMDTGHFSFGNGLIKFDGKELTIDLQNANIDIDGQMEELRGEFTTSLNEIKGQLEEKTTITNPNGTKESVVDKVSENSQKIDSITSRVTKAEKDIAEIDGNIVEIDKRVKKAETQLTDSSFTVRVEEILGDGGYVKGTQLKQEVDNITATIGAEGGYNLIRNSRGDINNNYMSSNMVRYSGSGHTAMTNGTYYRIDNKNTSSAVTGRTACFLVKPNTTYTFRFIYMVNDCCTGFKAYLNFFNDTSNVDSVVSGNNSSATAYTHPTSNKVWIWYEAKCIFTTPSDARSMYIAFRNVGTNNADKPSYLYITDMLLYEGATKKSNGEIICKPWSPHPSECYTVNVVMDGKGLTVNNGALTVKNDKGETIFTASNKKYMTMRGVITQYDADTGKKSISFENNGVNIYDHPSSGNSSLVGKFEFYETTNRANTTRRRGVRLYSSYSDIISLGHLNSSGNFIESIVLDGTMKYSGNQTNVSIYGVVGLYDVLTFRSTDRSYGGDILSDQSKLRIRTNFNSGGFIVFGQSNSLTDNIAELKKASFYHKGNISCGGNMSCKNMTCTGTLAVSGTKNRIVEVGKGYLSLNAYETAECYFGDIGEGVIGENGRIEIAVDEDFKKTIDLSVPYQVFITKYGAGECWVERKEESFIVHGTPNMKFGWELKAKQKGYTEDRLKKFDPITSMQN